MTDLLNPIDPPALQPLQQSFEQNQLESELKTVFMNVFASLIRDRERELNLYGMPHLGDTDLIERALKDAGLAIIRRDATRQSFLLKAATARNPRRGMIFLRAYLQSAWPNVWQVEPLWHPVATAANYPEDRTPLGTKVLGQAGTSTVTAEYAADSQDGIPIVYRADWQGKQQLYTTPRTNLFNNSTADTDVAGNGFWEIGPNAVRVDNVVGPDASNNAVAYSCTALGGCFISHLLSLTQGQTYTYSVWARIGSGMPNTGKLINVNNIYALAVVDSGISSQWQRFSLTFVASDAGSYGDSVPLYLATDYGEGASIHLFGAQIEVGGVTSYIPTRTAPVTVTDYVMDDDGVATFSDDVTPASPLTHFRTGRVRVTLPVTTDNGLGLLEIAKAFRSTLAPRLMLELRLSTIFENIGDTGGLALANGATAVMPLMAIGKLH